MKILQFTFKDKLNKKKVGKLVPFCCTQVTIFVWVTVMDVLNLNSKILYHYLRKTIIIEDGLLTYITKYIYITIKVIYFTIM